MANPFDQSGNEPQEQQQFQDKTSQEFFEEMVGEGKKYATPEDAVRALAHANHHIGKLEGENATQREKLTKAQTVDDIMSKLQQPPAAEQTPEQSDPANNSDPAPEVNVEELVKKMFTEQQQSQSAQTNKQQVVDAMKAQFGDKSVEVWDAVEAKLGVDLEQLSSNTPQAALQLLGVTKESGSEQPSSFNSTTRPPQGEVRPPEGSERLVNHLFAKGELTRQEAYKMKLKFSEDPAKYKS